MKAVVAALLACLTISACYVEEHDRRDGYPSSSSERYYDPVCGVEVYRDSPWHADYDGRAYYFHYRECRDRFRERPHAYVDHRDHRSREAR